MGGENRINIMGGLDMVDDNWRIMWGESKRNWDGEGNVRRDI